MPLLVWVVLVCSVQAQSLSAILDQAVAAQKSGDPETAIKLYREVLKQRPELAEIHSNIGAALVQEGRFADGIDEYKLALKAKPDNLPILTNLALAHYKAGNYSEVVSLLTPVQPRDPQNLQLTVLLSACLMQKSESKKVVALLSPLEEKYPNDQALAFLLGTALLNEGDVQHAQVILDRVLRDGESAQAQLLLGAMKLRAREFNGAIDNFKRAVALNPDLPEVHSYYGRALRASGDTPDAAKEFRAELAHNPADFVSNLELSVLLKQEGDLPGARKCLEAALRVRPEDAGALYQLASIDVIEGRNDQARAELEHLVQGNPSFLEAQVSLATIYYRLHRAEDGDRVRAIVRKLQQEQAIRDQAAEKK